VSVVFVPVDRTAQETVATSARPARSGAPPEQRAASVLPDGPADDMTEHAEGGTTTAGDVARRGPGVPAEPTGAPGRGAANNTGAATAGAATGDATVTGLLVVGGLIAGLGGLWLRRREGPAARHAASPGEADNAEAEAAPSRNGPPA
jgi:LPXTG-motif cell wall-anchored protein